MTQPASALTVLVVSPNAPYCAALVELLRESVPARTLADPDSFADADLPLVVVADGCALPRLPQARAAWPNALLICLLDYLTDWDAAIAAGADICVLKDDGGTELVNFLCYLAFMSPYFATISPALAVGPALRQNVMVNPLAEPLIQHQRI